MGEALQADGARGALRALGFENRERAGTFRDAMLPDGTADLAATRRPGTKKYGFGLNAEQEVTKDIGLFARYGWSDGKTEAWAFTQMDRSASGGHRSAGTSLELLDAILVNADQRAG
jgi:high affinity Mn2+ porin